MNTLLIIARNIGILSVKALLVYDADSFKFPQFRFIWWKEFVMQQMKFKVDADLSDQNEKFCPGLSSFAAEN